MLGTAGPAFAEDPTPEPVVVQTGPPAEPEEGDLDEEVASEEVQVPTETPPKAPEVPPAAPYEAGYSWESTGATQANTNNTSHSGKSTFTSETSGTVTVGVSGTYIWETKA
ncbi:hypothetical protein ACFRAO_20065 [Streptomyces sp. NPDC056656]|uniref:hypothetical protein n=1 Tax=Streptomyces sp. NPDC056656 TaxID=3345895 RepID=UPI003692C6F8